MKRRFYIVPTDMQLLGRVPNPRALPTDPVKTMDVSLLFLRSSGHHLTASGKHDWNGFTLVMVTGFVSAEYQEIFHAHPDVALLPDYETETAKTFGEHLASSDSKFSQKHLDALGALGIGAGHNIGDLFGQLCSRSADFMRSSREPLHFMYGSSVPEGVAW